MRATPMFVALIVQSGTALTMSSIRPQLTPTRSIQPQMALKEAVGVALTASARSTTTLIGALQPSARIAISASAMAFVIAFIASRWVRAAERSEANCYAQCELDEAECEVDACEVTWGPLLIFCSALTDAFA